MHDEGPYPPIVLADRDDLTAAVAADHASRDLTQGEVDDKGGKPLDPVVGGRQHLPVLRSGSEGSRGGSPRGPPH